MPPAHTFALVLSQCLSDSVRGVSWDLTPTNLFLVIVRFAIVRLEAVSGTQDHVNRALTFSRDRKKDAQNLRLAHTFWSLTSY